jgi:hypothetical protein
MADIIPFLRGDAAYHTFSIPATSWSAGGKLFFAAKPAIDDDTTDANALISGEWDDSSVTDVTVDGVAYKKYACTFPPSATNSILSNGSESADYLGEFQYVPATGVPITFPGALLPRLDAEIWFDVKRKTVV